jgi:hypothetical protein
MDRFQGLLARTLPLPRREELIGTHQGEQRSKIEQDEPATVKAAAAVIQKTTGRRPTRTEKRAAGALLHYLYGAAAGAAHGLLVELTGRRPSLPKGIASGLAVWLLADETLTPMLGIAPKPWESKPTAHALSAASHVVFGATTELARRALR